MADLPELKFNDLPELRFNDSKPAMQGQNILGMVGNVPGASNREAIRANPALAMAGPFASTLASVGIGGQKANIAATQGAMQPDKSQTFQDQALQSYYNKVGSGPLQTLGGFGVSTVGLVSDMITDPLNDIMMIAGVSPQTKQVLSETSKATKGLIQEVGTHLPQKMDDAWLIDKSKRLNDITNATIKSVKSEYEPIYEQIGGKSLNQTSDGKTLVQVMKDVFKEPDKISQSAIDEIKAIHKETPFQNDVKSAKQIKDIIQKYIPDSAWTKSSRGMEMSPGQEKLAGAWKDLQGLIYRSLDSDEAQGLSQIDEKYKNVVRTGNVIKRMLVDETGTPRKTGQLITTFSGQGSGAGRRELIQNMGKMNQGTNQIIKDMIKYNGRVKFKKMVRSTMPWVLGTTALGATGYEAGRIAQHISE